MTAHQIKGALLEGTLEKIDGVWYINHGRHKTCLEDIFSREEGQSVRFTLISIEALQEMLETMKQVQQALLQDPED